MNTTFKSAKKYLLHQELRHLIHQGVSLAGINTLIPSKVNRQL